MGFSKQTNRHMKRTDSKAELVTASGNQTQNSTCFKCVTRVPLIGRVVHVNRRQRCEREEPEVKRQGVRGPKRQRQALPGAPGSCEGLFNLIFFPARALAVSCTECTSTASGVGQEQCETAAQHNQLPGKPRSPARRCALTKSGTRISHNCRPLPCTWSAVTAGQRLGTGAWALAIVGRYPREHPSSQHSPPVSPHRART